WNAPSGPRVSNVELVPTRSWLKVVPCGSGTFTPSTWKAKRYVSGGTGTAVVAVHRPIASFVMVRPRVLPGWKPIGIASSMSLLVTRTSFASGAQMRNVTRPSASCSTDRYAAGEVNMPFGRQSAGAAGACLVVESEAVV